MPLKLRFCLVEPKAYSAWLVGKARNKAKKTALE